MWNFGNIFTAVLVLICALYTSFSAQMKMGTITKPGPGFVPVIIGSIGLLVSLILLITSLKKAEKEKIEKMDKEGMMRFLGYLIASIVFIPAFNFLGAIIAVFILILALTKFSGAKGWIYPVIFSVVSSAGFYILFEIVLSVSLPKGIF